MNSHNFSGAKWWKFDFHTHTPASECYGKGDQQEELKKRTPKQWLIDYMRAEIDCVAITDHNSGAWIDSLFQALVELKTEGSSDFRPLYLFPGVEISVHGGVHLLALFGSDKKTSDIDTLLGSIGYSGTKGKSDTVTNKTFKEVADAINKAGGIAIPAHVDGPSGLFEQKGTTLKQSLESEHIFAMELLDENAQKPQLYQDMKLHWTEVVGSDAHYPDADSGKLYPGRRFTWIKMGEPCLEGLRLALLDGPLSVKVNDSETDNPNKHAEQVIESIEINKTRYMGKQKPYHLDFSPWLNTLIGGRGTGKSSTMELLRLGLRRDKDLPEALQPEFAKYFNVTEDGILQDDSHITIVYKKHGDRYKIQWNAKGNVTAIQSQECDGSWQESQGKIKERFPASIYSQKQIFELARDPLALLRVIDDAGKVNKGAWLEQWKEEETRYLSLRAKIREIESKMGEEPKLQGELADVKKQIEIFEKAGYGPILQEYRKRQKQKRMLEEWENGWIDAGKRIHKVAEDILPELLDAKDFSKDDTADAGLIECANSFHNKIKGITDQLKRLSKMLDATALEWTTQQNQSDWKKALDSAINNYNSLCETLKRNNAGNPAIYGELVQRRQLLESRIKDMGSLRTQLDDICKTATKSLEHLLEIRRDLTHRRQDFLKETLSDNQFVKINILPYQAKDNAEADLRRIIQRETGGYEKDINKFLTKIYHGDRRSESLECRINQIKNEIIEISEGKLEGHTLEDKRFATHLGRLSPETYDRLQCWFPEDSIKVEYKGNDGKFCPIQEGSPGQKTAALLAFLLSYGEEPLILDQPEDDLDNHLIYSLIVAQLRSIKQHRQVIVVTHNANIVVNGDAELVISLIAKGGETDIECEGCLQERKVRDTICDVMEGGKTAFEQRYRRIKLENTNV